jgi:hypothetical protein
VGLRVNAYLGSAKKVKSHECTDKFEPHLCGRFVAIFDKKPASASFTAFKIANGDFIRASVANSIKINA